MISNMSEKGNCIDRNSSIEFLRILCIFGIVSMHSMYRFYYTVTGFNLMYYSIGYSLFNVGVSIFALISGYYGIKFGYKKFIKLWFEVLFYSVLSTILTESMRGGGIG